MMKIIGPAFVACVLSLLTTSPLLAQPASMPMAMPMASRPSSDQGSTTSAEVRKVDTSAQKLTLKHGEIKNLGMPGMTMVFKVSDPKMLLGATEGDKIRFTADRIDGALTVTSMEMATQ